jgi:hypothetical protein
MDSRSCTTIHEECVTDTQGTADLLFSYMYNEIADRLDTHAVLSERGELLTVSKHLAVSGVVAFPFLSAQLKFATSGVVSQKLSGRHGVTVLLLYKQTTPYSNSLALRIRL